jgi:hypothetical protein
MLQNGDIIYAKKCHNCDLTERVLHHILDKHRLESNTEWFEISNELAIYTINMVCSILDNFVNSSEKLPYTNINNTINEICKQINSENKQDTDTNHNVFIDIKDTTTIDTTTININSDQKNYDKFLQDFFEYREDYYCVQYDVINAYRIWSRGDVNNKTKHEISTFMKSKFEYKDRYLPECEGRVQVYIGLQLKPLQYESDNIDNLKSYEKFFLENCHIGYTFRIKTMNFINEYTKWLGVSSLSKSELLEVRAYFTKKFLIGRVDKNTEGWWGFQLKTDALPKYGLSFRRRKKIIKIDATTKNIIDEYQSLMMASMKLNICYKSLSDKVKFQRIIETQHGNFILKYIDE